MDIALHTLVLIIFLLIPGVIFRRVYFQGGFSSQFDSKSWSHSLFFSVVFGMFLQIISFCIYSAIYKDFNDFDVQEFYTCLKESMIPTWLMEFQNILNLAKYLGFTFLIAFTLGVLLHHFVRALKLDLSTTYLRFNNHWYYFFKGEVRKFDGFGHLPAGEFGFTNVDVLVNMEDGTNRLYSGNLVEHTISNTTGELENIYLINPQRYDTVAGVTTLKRIPGDCLIIPNSKIINFNLTYFRINNAYSVSKSVVIVLLILGYSFIWLDPLSLIDAVAWKQFFIKFLLHIDWWLLILLITVLLKKPITNNLVIVRRDLGISVACLLVLTVVMFFIFN